MQRNTGTFFGRRQDRERGLRDPAGGGEAGGRTGLSLCVTSARRALRSAGARLASVIRLRRSRRERRGHYWVHSDPVSGLKNRPSAALAATPAAALGYMDFCLCITDATIVANHHRGLPTQAVSEQPDRSRACRRRPWYTCCSVFVADSHRSRRPVVFMSFLCRRRRRNKDCKNDGAKRASVPHCASL